MKRIGQILLEQGWVSPEHLLRALNHQKLVGGRLGTCLLEMEAVEERLLLRALSLQLGVPAADLEDLRGVADEVAALLPAKVARRCQAVPFRLLGGQLSIALLGVRDLAIQDELAFVSGKRLRVHVANEARIFEALERYYGEECPQRFVQLLDRINRARYLWDRPSRETEPIARAATAGDAWELPPPKPAVAPPPPPLAVPVPPPVSPALPQTAPVPSAIASPPPTSAPVEPSTAPSPVAGASPLPGAAAGASPTAPPLQAPPRAPLAVATTDASPALAAPADRPAPTAPPSEASPVEPITLAEVERRLQEASDRDDVGRVLIEYLAPRFTRVVLLSMKKDGVGGWMGSGEGIDAARLGSLRLSLAPASVFATLREGRPSFRGPIPPLPAHQDLAAAWGGTLPTDSLMLSIPVRKRTAAIIYVDHSPAPIGNLDLDGMHRLAELAGAALEACIRRQKSRTA